MHAFLKRERLFTSVAVIQIGKLLPLVILHKADERAFDIRPHLQNKLVESVSWKTGRDEGHVQRLAERRDGVHRLLVVEAKDGINSSGKL